MTEKKMFSRKTVQAARRIVAEELTGLVLAETIQRIGVPAEHDAALAAVRETAQKLCDSKTKEFQAVKKPLPQILEDFEKALIESALKRSDWKTPAAARALGISERSLANKISKFGILPEAAPEQTPK